MKYSIIGDMMLPFEQQGKLFQVVIDSESYIAIEDDEKSAENLAIQEYSSFSKIFPEKVLAEKVTVREIYESYDLDETCFSVPIMVFAPNGTFDGKCRLSQDALRCVMIAQSVMETRG